MASPQDKLIGLYEGVEIWQNAGELTYYFFYGEQVIGGFLNIEDVYTRIDELRDPLRNNVGHFYVHGARGLYVIDVLVQLQGKRAYTSSLGYAELSGLRTGRHQGLISKGSYEHDFVVDILTGFHEYHIYGTDLEDVEIEEPEPTPEPSLNLEEIERRNGAVIYRVVAGFEYYFSLKGVQYGPYDSIQKVYDEIDRLTAVIGPQEPTEQGVPLNLGWFSGIASWFGGLWSDGVNTGLAVLGAINGIGSAIGGIGSSIVTGLIDNLGSIFRKTAEESINSTLNIIPEATGHSPEWKQQLDASVQPFKNEALGNINAALDPKTYEHSALTPEDAASKLTLLGAGITAANVGIWLAHLAAEAGTLGQLEAVGDFADIVINNTGINSVASRMALIPLERLIFKPAEYHYNAQYTPEIPPYSDLINMLVKEKITQEEFNKNLAYQGYSEKWAKLIWDAHFQAPDLGDILTAWRRGLITEEQVDQLMILVDLDPAFKYIFDVRKYDDPSLSTARLMYETGVISKEEVQEIVKRSGLSLDFQPRMVDYIITFQERRWRTRYLQSLATGYSRGVVEKEELTNRIKEAGYSEGTAEWIVKSSDIRKEIGQRGERFTGPKLLNVADLKKSLERGYISEDQFRQEMLLRNYNLNDIDIMVRLLKEDITEFEQGGVKVALTQSELLNAWRYGQLSEDALSIELQLRGLEPPEVEMLIATKKIQWKLGEEET